MRLVAALVVALLAAAGPAAALAQEGLLAGGGTVCAPLGTVDSRPLYLSADATTQTNVGTDLRQIGQELTRFGGGPGLPPDVGYVFGAPMLEEVVPGPRVLNLHGLESWRLQQHFALRSPGGPAGLDDGALQAWRQAALAYEAPSYGPGQLDQFRLQPAVTVQVAIAEDCLQWRSVERIRLPDDQEMEMTGGTEPDPDGTLLVQQRLNQTFALAGAAPSGVPDGGCDRLTRTTLDTCFLPGVGIINDRGDGTVGCSGTIVGPRHVLTAAHCVCVRGATTPFIPGGILLGLFGGYPSAFYVDTPLHGADIRLIDSLVAPEGASALVRIADVRVAHDYCTNREALNDLALLTLAESVALPPQFQARLTAPPPAGSTINIAGFGRDRQDADAGHELRNVKRYLSATFRGFQSDMLRVETPLGDSCQGDSGSGAYLRQADGSLLVFGVLSRGDRECRSTVPATYVDITNARYAELLSALPGFLALTVAGIPAADIGTCLGDNCPGDMPWKRTGAVN